MMNEVLGREQVILDEGGVMPIGFIVDIMDPSLDTSRVSSDMGYRVEDVLIR